MISTRKWLEAREFPACVYCGKVQANQLEHVVPRSMRSRHHIDKRDARFHVPSCSVCNLRKSTYHLYPRGFDATILPGKGWRPWDGTLPIPPEPPRRGVETGFA